MQLLLHVQTVRHDKTIAVAVITLVCLGTPEVEEACFISAACRDLFSLEHLMRAKESGNCVLSSSRGARVTVVADSCKLEVNCFMTRTRVQRDREARSILTPTIAEISPFLACHSL